MQGSGCKRGSNLSLQLDPGGQWLAGAGCGAPGEPLSFLLYHEPAWCCGSTASQQSGGRSRCVYHNDSCWEGKISIPVARQEAMADRSWASQVTVQPGFHCTRLSRVPRGGEQSLQYGRSHPRKLHLVINCLCFVLFGCFFKKPMLKLLRLKLSMLQVNLGLNFPGSGNKEEKYCLAPALIETACLPVPWCKAPW